MRAPREAHTKYIGPTSLILAGIPGARLCILKAHFRSAIDPVVAVTSPHAKHAFLRRIRTVLTASAAADSA